MNIVDNVQTQAVKKTVTGNALGVTVFLISVLAVSLQQGSRKTPDGLLSAEL